MKENKFVYPEKYAIMEIRGYIFNNKLKTISDYDELIACFPAPCYVMSETKKYHGIGGFETSSEVVFKWEDSGVLVDRDINTTKDGYGLIARRDEVDVLFDTYEEAKEYATEVNQGILYREKGYARENLAEEQVQSHVESYKRIQDKYMKQADEKFYGTKKLDGCVAQQVMSALTKDENLSSVAKGLKNAKGKEVRTLVDDDGQNEFCC